MIVLSWERCMVWELEDSSRRSETTCTVLGWVSFTSPYCLITVLYLICQLALIKFVAGSSWCQLHGNFPIPSHCRNYPAGKKLTKNILGTLTNQTFSASPPCKRYEANQLWTKLRAEIGMNYVSYLNWTFFSPHHIPVLPNGGKFFQTAVIFFGFFHTSPGTPPTGFLRRLLK